MHRNFKSSTLLLDDKLTVRASNCGLARLISSVSVNEVNEGSNIVISSKFWMMTNLCYFLVN